MWPLALTRAVGLVCVGGLLVACGTNVVSHPITAATKSMNPAHVAASTPATGRLTRPFDQGFSPTGYSLGNYRMDAARRSTHPRMTPQQVLDALYRSRDASFARQAEAHVITRFGPFTGFDVTVKNCKCVRFTSSVHPDGECPHGNLLPVSCSDCRKERRSMPQ